MAHNACGSILTGVGSTVINIYATVICSEPNDTKAVVSICAVLSKRMSQATQRT